MMKKFFLFTACCCIYLFAFTQKEDSLIIRRIADDILKNGKAYEDLRYICKKIGARLSGSANAAKAVEATAKMLREAGADTVYLQPCMVPHWVRGEKEQGIIQWGKNKKALSVCALGMSIGTPAAGIKAEVIEVADFEELKKLGAEKVKGKIVFFNYPMKPELIFGGYGDAVRYRGAGPVEAAKLGAVAVMIRSVTHALDNNPHTGTTRYDSAVNKIPAMACSTLDAEWLHGLFKKEKKVEMFMKMGCKKLPDVLSYNVVGEIRGSEFPGEIITAGGHLDSWDLGEGAHDDGAGCVQSIQIIRTIKALDIKPKRTIRCVLFMNEENGLAGGNKYAELAGLNKENHIFAIESDAGGFGIETLGLSGKPEQAAKVRSWLPLFRPYGIYDMPDGGGGADIGPLRKYGTFMCEVNPGTQRYFDYHHAPNDVFEAVHKRELEMGAIGMTAIVFLVDKYGL
jgi:hypothetical protein